MGEGWKLDKHIPAALIVAIGIQVATSIWYASKLDSRVSELEAWTTKREGEGSLIIRMDERLKMLSEQVNDLSQDLRRVKR